MATIWKYDVGGDNGTVFATGVPPEAVHRLIDHLNDYHKGISLFKWGEADVVVEESFEESKWSEIVALAHEAEGLRWKVIEREMILGDYRIRERIER
jgi:hypothetical protein